MKKITVIIMLMGLLSVKSKAQFVVSDPMHTGITSLIKLIQDPSFKSMVKNIEALKKVVGAVQQFHRGKEIIVKIGNCTKKLAALSTAVAKDGHIYSGEFDLLAQDIQSITAAGTNILKDMKTATTASGSVLKMTDGERVKWLDETFKRVSLFESMINKYSDAVKFKSMKRSGNQYDLSSTARLYAAVDQVGTGYGSGDLGNGYIVGSGYDGAYSTADTSALDNFEKSEKAKLLQKKMLECQQNQQNYYDELEIMNIKMDDVAMAALMLSGYTYEFGKTTFTASAGQQSLVASVTNPQDGTSPTTALNMVTGGFYQNMDAKDTTWIGPGGRAISKEEMDIRIRMKARELALPLEAALRLKWKLDECLSVGN